MRLSSVYLLLVLVVSGCSEQQQLAIETLTSDLQNLSVNSYQNKSCSIALSALPNAEKSTDITRYQTAVVQQQFPFANLEKLGWAFITLAQQRFDPGYYTLAQQAALCLADKQPDSVSALVLQAHALNNLHRFKEAEALAIQAVAKRGLWFEFAVLGDAQMEQGKLVEAVDSYQQMADQRPGPQAYSRAAHLRWLHGDLDGAIELMLLSLQSNQGHVNQNTAWAQVRLAQYLFQKDDLNSAQQLLEQLVSWKADYAPALLTLGRIYLAQSKLSQAIPLLTKAEQLNPLPEYQWVLIEALKRSGLDNQVRLVKQRINRTGAIEDKRTYAQYLAASGENISLAVNLAEQELQIREDILTKDAIAWALYKANRKSEALTYIKQALSVGTADARLFYHAACIYQANAQDAQASHWFSKAFKLQHLLYPSEQRELLIQSGINAVFQSTVAPVGVTS